MLKIKELREQKGYTQQELAEMLSRKKASICDWEKGRCEPSIFDLIKLADIYNCSIDYLLGREDEFGIIQAKNELTQAESQLLTLFKTLNERDQNKVLGYVQALAY